MESNESIKAVMGEGGDKTGGSVGRARERRG